MNILMIHNYYKSSNIGGEDIVFRREVTCLKKHTRSNRVYVYTVSNDNIDIVSLFCGLTFSLNHYYRVKKLIIKKNIDIVHVHNFFPLMSASVLMAAKEAGAKVIWTMHNYRHWCLNAVFYRKYYGICETCAERSNFSEGIKQACYRNSKLASFVLGFSLALQKLINIDKYIDKYIVLTRFQKNKSIKYGLNKDKIVVKPNFFMPIKYKANLNKKLDDTFVFVGRLEEGKGIDRLVKYWGKLDKKYKLFIIGSGELEDSLKSLNVPNIIFIGKLDNKKTLSIIRKCKFLVQPSVWYETFGLTMIEALSFGTPVIGLDIGTRSEFIIDGKTGFLVNSFGELVNQVIKSSRMSTEEYNCMSDNCIEYSALFKANVLVDRQLALYRNVIS